MLTDSREFVIARRGLAGGAMECLLVLFAVILLLVASSTVAAELCVGSVEALDNALAIASSPTGQTTVIEIQQGTYNVAGSRLLGDYDYNAMQLLGGYNSDCSARTLDPDNTILDAHNPGFTFGDFEMYGDLKVEGIRFANFGFNATLEFDPLVDDLSFTIANNEFFNAAVYVSGGNSGTTLNVLNNLAKGFATTGDPVGQSDAPLYFSDIDGTILLTSNTVADNAGDGIFICNSANVRIIDNIAWGNLGEDIDVFDDCSTETGAGAALLQDNIWGIAFVDQQTGSIGNLVSDPQFVDAANGNYRLQGASPAVNSGTLAVQLASVDLDANPRVVGSTVDRGAYESNVDGTISTTLTVTNTNDSGAGSLRQAILDANANADYDYIVFDIPGACARSIIVSTNLPAITHGVSIDGFTQPGSAKNTALIGDNAIRCIFLFGGTGVTTGLVYSGDSSSFLWLQGIEFLGFNSGSGGGVQLQINGGADNLIWGNAFSGGGFFPLPDSDIQLLGGTTVIGGSQKSMMNVIDASTVVGIDIHGDLFGTSNDNQIIGNLIGTFGDGTTEVSGNAVGVIIASSGNTLSNNLIVNSSVDGVQIHGNPALFSDPHDNTIDSNSMGKSNSVCLGNPPVCSSTIAPNARYGVLVDGGAHDNAVTNNTIWNNGSEGISVADNGHGNDLAYNSIYDNGTYGIDLVGVEGNDNDADPSAANLPNRGLNFPVITRAYGGSSYGWVEGSLDSINSVYSIDIYSSPDADNTAYGEGRTFHSPSLLFGNLVEIDNAPSGNNGHVDFRMAFSRSSVSLVGSWFSLIARDSSDFSTSEFSPHEPYDCDVIFANGVDDNVGNGCPAP